METLELGVRPLSLEDVYACSVQTGEGKNRTELRKVVLSSAAVEKIQNSYQYLQTRVGRDEPLYGINTGFGFLSNIRIPSKDIKALQYNLLRSHACGMGQPLSDEYVRAMLLLRASTLAQGFSGVSLGLVQQILNVLNSGIVPIVPEQGSVGASGDLAPLSHLGLVLIGEGKARFPRLRGTEIMSGAQALELAGLRPVELGPKEGLALINGTQFMTAIGVLNLLEAEHLCNIADFAGCMSLEATRGSTVAFDSLLHEVRPHPGQVKTAANIRKLLLSGGVSEIAQSHENCGKVQDPYSFRCMPQVHGASRDTLAYVRQVLEREINSVTDNPLIFPKEDKILSGGNFHGQYVAIAMDVLSIAVAELGSISEQRIEKLINPAFSGLPAFLTAEGGINSGFMIVQVAAASIVSENKTLCHPASVDSIPTSTDKEDHVSMGAWAARKAANVVTNTRRVLSLELLAGAQGIDLLRPMKSSECVEKVHRLIRSRVKKLEADRVFHDDFGPMDELVGSDEMKQILSHYV